MRLRLRSLPITDVPLAVVDVESTGLSAESGDRVCEVAVVRVDPGGEPDLYCSLVNPGRPIEPAARAVNGISDADLADAPPFTAVIDTVSAYIDGAVLVAHNAPFDVAFLSAEYAIAQVEPPEVPVLDTLALARRCFRFRRNNLGAVAREFRVPTANLHRASGDALTTYHVFKRMVALLADRNLNTVDDLLVAQGRVRAPLAVPKAHAVPEPIVMAVEDRKPVTICYTDGTGHVTERMVDPLWVNRDYLIGYCRLRKAQRTFRLDRIVDAWLS